MQFSKTFSKWRVKSLVAKKFKVKEYGLTDKEDNTDKTEDLKSSEEIQQCPPNKYTYTTAISFFLLSFFFVF